MTAAQLETEWMRFDAAHERWCRTLVPGGKREREAQQQAWGEFCAARRRWKASLESHRTPLFTNERKQRNGAEEE